MAFEMTHNLIQVWAWPLHGVCARNSYCLGVTHELKDITKTEQRAAGRAAKENEAKSTAATTPVDELMETDRGEYESEDVSDIDSILADFNDEDSDMPDVTASFEPELEKFAQAKSGPSKDQITSEPEQAEWASSMQLAVYRQNVGKITEDVLKANNVQLCARK